MPRQHPRAQAELSAQPVMTTSFVSICYPDLQPSRTPTHQPTHPPGSIFTSDERLPMPVTILYCFKKSLKSNLAAGWRGSARGHKVGLQRLCKGGGAACCTLRM